MSKVTLCPSSSHSRRDCRNTARTSRRRENLLRKWLIASLITLPLAASCAKAQDAASDIKPDHWAYAAVEDLAKKGLIKGYPPDGKFLGGRTLSRYEMATIIKRILDRMDEIVKQPKPGGTVGQEDIDKL